MSNSPDLYSDAHELPLDLLETAQVRAPERSVLMVDPSDFNLDYAINPHMQDGDGNLHSIHQDRAIAGHQALLRIYEQLGYPIHVIRARADLPDMVFAANQSFPFVSAAGERSVLLSAMAHRERRREVPLVEAFYKEQGYRVHSLSNLPPESSLEGMGDVLWWPGRRLMVAAHGFRTSPSALVQVAEIVGAPMVCVQLIDPRFYHLDMALTFLDEQTALWNPAAFTKASRRCLQAIVPNLLIPPEMESRIGFSCNAHAPRAGEVIVDASLTRSVSWLSESGFTVHTPDVSEFHKAGGSVFCLKMMLP